MGLRSDYMSPMPPSREDFFKKARKKVRIAISSRDNLLIQSVSAVDELNKKGGVLGKKLEFVNLDGKSDPVTVGNVAVELIKKGVKAIIAPSDFDFGGPASREAQKAGIVGISNPPTVLPAVLPVAATSSAPPDSRTSFPPSIFAPPLKLLTGNLFIRSVSFPFSKLHQA